MRTPILVLLSCTLLIQALPGYCQGQIAPPAAVGADAPGMQTARSESAVQPAPPLVQRSAPVVTLPRAQLRPEDAPQPPWFQTLALALIASLAALGGFMGAWLGRRATTSSRRASRWEAPSPGFLSDDLLDLEPVGGDAEEPRTGAPTADDRRILDYLRATFGERMETQESARAFFDGLFKEIDSLRTRVQAKHVQAPTPERTSTGKALPNLIAMAGHTLKAARTELCIEQDFEDFDLVLGLAEIEAQLQDFYRSAISG